MSESLVDKRLKYIERQRALHRETVDVRFEGLTPSGSGPRNRDGMKRSVRKLRMLRRMATGYAEYADATPMQAVDQSAAAVAVPWSSSPMGPTVRRRSSSAC